MRNKNTNLNEGFTLIEILMVVAIIGLMSTIVTTVAVQLRNRAKITKMASDLRQISTAFSFYYNENGHLPPRDDHMQNPLDDTCEQVALSPYIQWPKTPFGGNYNWSAQSVVANYTLEIHGMSMSNSQLLDNTMDDGNLSTGELLWQAIDPDYPALLVYTGFGDYVGVPPNCP